MRVIDHLQTIVRSASKFNADVQIEPACIIWPDPDKQWESAVGLLQGEMPELVVLGDYLPQNRIGPAIWLRCVIAGPVDGLSLPSQYKPILYLPGVSRQDLRAIDKCPDPLKPLAELQYRGVFWSQQNTKDWTVLAFLKSKHGGLGLNVAQDTETKKAMVRALDILLDQDSEFLSGKYLDREFFNALLAGDPDRDMLHWLERDDKFRESQGEAKWNAFNEVCKSRFSFNPPAEGVLAGAAKLANHEGPWLSVWKRFCEAPNKYPNIPDQIRKCQPPNTTLEWEMPDGDYGGWPQWNQEREERLRQDLRNLNNLPEQEGRDEIIALENVHGSRRDLVWAETGHASLACAMEHLAALAKITASNLASGTIKDLEKHYCDSGWKADDAAVSALAELTDVDDVEAVSIAIRAIYLPWLERSARHLQGAVNDTIYPSSSISNAIVAPQTDNEVVLFVDGLRFDVGKRLSARLKEKEFDVVESPFWVPLPSVTATGKPAVTPIAHKINGSEVNSDFEPCVAETGQSLKGGNHLRRLLKESGWDVLSSNDNGTGQGYAWCEFGNIDHVGHEQGARLARHLEALVLEIAARIASLLSFGWQRVRVVTDHGWLLLPGTLPKIDLPSILTENKWGRCAALKPGSRIEGRVFPWFWNPNLDFALADGVSCFRMGMEYAHGGLSLQECLTLHLAVTRGESSTKPFAEIVGVSWKGLRCTVEVEGNFASLTFDVRTEAGNHDSSVVVNSKFIKDNGTASVVVEDERLDGCAATLVLIDSSGSLIAQAPTTIGGGK